jgi:hypothetical protein
MHRHGVSTAAREVPRTNALQRRDEDRRRDLLRAQKEDVMKIIGIVTIGLALLASGAVAAKDSPNGKRHINASEYYGLYHDAAALASSAAIGRSGTAGREDFGESPFYPEGPGNVAD